MKKEQRLRRVFLTWNNWQTDFETKEKAYDYFKALPHIKAFILGFEVGEQGTHHIQAVIQFTQSKRFSTLRNYFKNNHIERVYDFKKAIEYCKKENDFLEHGELTKQGHRTDIEQFTQAIIDGYSNMELLAEFPSQTQRYLSNIDKIRQMALAEHYSKELRHDLKVIYLSGSAGVGKTRYIYDTYDISDIYRVSDYNNPFDNYKGQKILVLDEYDNQLPIQLLLNVIDIYPMLLPARYHDKWACYEKVYIISNHEYNKVFGMYNDELNKAVKRRIDLITPYMTFDNVVEVYTELDKFNEYENRDYTMVDKYLNDMLPF